MPGTQLSQADVREHLADVISELIGGRDDSEIMDLFGWGAEDYERIKLALYEREADAIRNRPPEHTYVDFVISQKQVLKKLDGVIEDAEDVPKPNTAALNTIVGALKLKSQIISDVVDKGFELGVVKKTPEKQVVIGGVQVFDAGHRELVEMVVNSLETQRHMLERFGEDSMLDVPVDRLHQPVVVVGETSVPEDRPPSRLPPENPQKRSNKASKRSRKPVSRSQSMDD